MKGDLLLIVAVGMDAKNFCEFFYARKTVLVMGSEEKGVGMVIRKPADHIARIPMQRSIDSLNVSQSVAVLLSRKTGN